MSSSQASPSKASIVTHPWFPKAIGLWCAALFGLCSLAVGSDVLERVVTLLGIDRIVPAAAPPLGQTARLLLAMGMAGVGEIAGLLIGGWLAASRRRGKILPRSDEPGERGDADPIAMLSMRARDRHADAPPRRPLSAIDDLGDGDKADEDSEVDKEPRPVAGFSSLPVDEWLPAETAGPETQTETAVEGSQSAPTDALDLAICDASPEEQVLPMYALEGDPAEAVPTPVVLIEPAPAPVAIASAPLETLGVVQLSERLALALAARRERRAQRLATAAALAPEDSADEPANGGYSSLLAMGSSFPRPDAVRIEEPPSDVVEPVAIFPGHGARAEGNFPAPATQAGAAASLSGPADQAVAVSAQADPEETGRALRAALASLQRISGAR